MSKIINKILENPDSTTSERVRLGKEWLQTDYQIKNVKDIKVLEEAFNVHDHDNMALHFGEVYVGSTFTAGYIRVVEVGEGWHLAFSREAGKNFTIIHPSYEKAGQNQDNIKLLSLVRTLLSKGTLVQAAVAPVQATESLLVKGLEEKPVTDENDLTESYVNIADFGAPTVNTSVSINMDDYLK